MSCDGGWVRLASSLAHDHVIPIITTTTTATCRDIELRVRALESLLVEKGYVDPAALDAIVETYETKVGPRNGAHVVAKAWTDPAFRDWLLRGRHRGHRLARLQRPAGRAHGGGREHAGTSTTSSSARCAPATRGRCSACRRSGTSRAPYRSRAVIDPRGVLAEFGVTLPETTRIRVWDSHRRAPLPRHPDAPGGHRGLERGARSPSSSPAIR